MVGLVKVPAVGISKLSHLISGPFGAIYRPTWNRERLTMLHNPETATMLGFNTARPMTPVSFLDLIVQGFPVATLDRVSGAVAPADSAFKYRIVSKTTLARRRKHDDDRLSTDESERLVRLTDVWATAVDVWKTEEAARAFLFRPHAMLDGRLPIDVVLQAEVGAQIVKEILGRLKYGSAA